MHLIKYILALIVLFAFCPRAIYGQLIEIEEPLGRYIAEGIQNNPGLEAFRSKVEALRHEIPQAGAWRDPTVSFSMMNLPVNSFDFNQEPMTAFWINVGQTIPLAGKPALRSKIAGQKLESHIGEQISRELSIGSELARTWYDWAYLQAALATVDRNIELMDDFIEAATTKYETGRGMQQDILRAETNRVKLEDLRAEIGQTKLTTMRKFARLLGRSDIKDLKQPSTLPKDFSDVDVDGLTEKIMAQNPNYRQMKSEAAVSKTKLELSERAWFPDLKLGAGYGFRQNADGGLERPDFFSITAGMSVPIFGSRKQGRSIQQMAAMERAARSKLKAIELDLKFKLEKLLDEDKKLAEQIALYREGVEPQAEAALAASTSSYTVGKADFEALLMAETTLYNARLERLARVRDRLKVRVAIAELIGGNALLKENLEND